MDITMALRWLIEAPLLGVAAGLALVSLYLALLAVASFAYRARRLPASPIRRRFAVVVPAHNEAASIGRLLASILAVEYPSSAYEVCIVADNCTDSTATIARAAGASVYERFDTTQHGKGHALRWLLGRLPLADFDAVVIVDADSIVSRNLLTVANAALAAGDRVCQVYDGVLNGADSPSAGLRALAFDLHNRVRPMGQEVLGTSVGLMGNGMIIATSLLSDDLWGSFGLAEDIEFHVQLLLRGERVRFLPQASALAEMPSSLAGAKGQNVRWEAGRLAAARRLAPRLLVAGLRQRRRVLLLAGLDLLVPPQSAQLLFGAVAVVAALLLPSTPLHLLAATIVGGQIVYVLAGLVQLRRLGASLACLAYAPPFVGWKALLYVHVLVGGGSRQWVRGVRRESTG